MTVAASTTLALVHAGPRADVEGLRAAEARVATIASVEEAKELHDRADAMARYLRNARRGLMAQNRCALIKFQCERRGGELLRAVPTVQGRRGAQGLLAEMARSAIPLTTAYEWMRLAGVPRAEERLRWLAARCDLEGCELTRQAVRTMIVEPWLNRRAQVSFSERATRDKDTPIMTEHLLELGVLLPGDLAGLSPTQEAVLVREVHAAYMDLTEDVEHGKVAGMDNWNPPVTTDVATLRRLVAEVVRDLKAGKIGHRAIRGLVRIDELLKVKHAGGAVAAEPISGELRVRHAPNSPFGRFKETARRLTAAARTLTAPGLLGTPVVGTLASDQRVQVRALAADVRAALVALEAATAAPGDDASVSDDT